MEYIYLIINKVNSKFYLGSTKFLLKRKKTHFRKLKNKTHHNIILQRAYNKYGKKNFIFVVIETCFDCRKREQELLNIIDFKDSYNISKTSSGGNLIHNHPNRETLIKNAIEVLKKSKKAEPKYGKDNGNWKGGVSKSNCLICNKVIKGCAKHCNKCYYKQRDSKGKNNPFYGKTHSEEVRKKLSEQRKGKINISQCKQIIINGVEYISITEAAKAFNVCGGTILNRLKSKTPKYKNYNYKGETKESYTKEEHKKILSDPHKGKTRKHNKPFFIENNEYRTLKEASDKLNLHISTIKRRLLSKNKKFINYYYK